MAGGGKRSHSQQQGQRRNRHAELFDEHRRKYERQSIPHEKLSRFGHFISMLLGRRSGTRDLTFEFTTGLARGK